MTENRQNSVADTNAHCRRKTLATKIASAIESHERVIVILGAGASADSGIPVGRKVGRKFTLPDRSILQYELSAAPKAWPFFDVVDVLVKFRGPEYVQKQLQEILEPKYISLGNEILSHYLHHDKINAVITVNHDESFDNSLLLESPKFEHIARSRSEFDALLEKIPPSGIPPKAYLKVHGCVSRKLTFRIDSQSVVRLESEKLLVLEKYFETADLILCIGWSMHDPDVFRPLAEALERDKKKVRKNTKQQRTQLIVVTRSLTRDLKKLVNELGGEICASEAGKFISDLGKSIEKPTEKPGQSSEGVAAKGVGLHRHRIRALCFGREGRLKRDKMTQATMEVLMFALKARAQIEPKTLFECGRTSQLLAEAGAGLLKKEAKNSTVPAEQNECTPPLEQIQVRALAEILERLRDNKILDSIEGDHGEIYWLRSSLTLSAINDADEILKNIAKEVASKLNSKEFRRGRNPARRDRNWEHTLKKHLTKLTTAFDVDVIPRARDFAMFSNPKVLDNKKSFEDETVRLIGSLKQGEVLCVSTNTGEWLRYHVRAIRKHENECRILIEDYNADVSQKTNPFKRIAELRSNEFDAKLEKYNIPRKVIPQKNKFHQLTARFDVNMACLDAIYFRREGKSTRISPVRLSTPKDLEQVAKIWRQLWPN